MKKILLIIMLSLLLIGCNSKKEKVLLCVDGDEKYIFKFDNNNVNRIYYEKDFLFRNYYTDEEIDEFKDNPLGLMFAIENSIKDCNLEEYACNSSYDNFVIKNKYYIDSKKEASIVNLDMYYGLNKDDVRTRVISNMKKSTCRMVDDSDLYFVKGNKTTIKMDKEYNSISQMHKDLTKEKYYREYTLVEMNGKKATIEFMEDGKCKIDLSEFNEDIYTNSFCEPNHKLYIRFKYDNGNCTYKVDDHIFIINYDGVYGSGSYCETHEDSIIFDQKPVVPYKEIELEFDDDYESFKYNNGYWNKDKVVQGLTFRS